MSWSFPSGPPATGLSGLQVNSTLTDFNVLQDLAEGVPLRIDLVGEDAVVADRWIARTAEPTVANTSVSAMLLAAECPVSSTAPQPTAPTNSDHSARLDAMMWV